MRKNRLEIIKRILIEQHISDQADLLKALRKVGIQTTQATISRDIRTLKVKKIRNSEGHSRYILPKEPETDIMLMPQGEKETIVRVSYNGPWAVIRTRPGYAQGVAADL
ncbi:MAG: hypothetical protein IJ680_08330, partial [Paludibacteraceae bacterium]|nr:hypothetical protein [Paludibacteraceae bacterium]